MRLYGIIGLLREIVVPLMTVAALSCSADENAESNIETDGDSDSDSDTE